MRHGAPLNLAEHTQSAQGALAAVPCSAVLPQTRVLIDCLSG